MTLVDASTGEIVADCTPEEARQLTDRLRSAVAVAWDLVAEAYTSKAWAALGYETWDAYCLEEFGATHLRLPAEERTEVVRSLHAQGLTIRAIAAATGSSVGSVHGATKDEDDACSKMNTDEIARTEGVGDDPQPAASPAPSLPTWEEKHPDLATRKRFDKAMASFDRVRAFDPGPVADGYCTDEQGMEQIKHFMQALRRFAQGLEDGIKRNQRMRSVK